MLAVTGRRAISFTFPSQQPISADMKAIDIGDALIQTTEIGDQRSLVGLSSASEWTKVLGEVERLDQGERVRGQLGAQAAVQIKHLRKRNVRESFFF